MASGHRSTSAEPAPEGTGATKTARQGSSQPSFRPLATLAENTPAAGNWGRSRARYASSRGAYRRRCDPFGGEG